MHASWAAYKFNLVVTAKLLLLGFENSYYGVYSVVHRRRLEILLLCVAVSYAVATGSEGAGIGNDTCWDDVCSPT